MIKTFGLAAVIGVLVAIGIHAWLGFNLSEQAAFALYFICVAVVEILALLVKYIRGKGGDVDDGDKG